MLNEGDPEESDCLRNGDGERHENASASAERISLFPLASSSQPLTDGSTGPFAASLGHKGTFYGVKGYCISSNPMIILMRPVCPLICNKGTGEDRAKGQTVNLQPFLPEEDSRG